MKPFMKIMLLGKNGQVGWELQRTMAPLGQVMALDWQELNLTDEQAIRRIIRDICPDLLVNAAAYTAVDQAEEEQDLAMAVNGTAPGIIAEEVARYGAALIHYSTDYIFDGNQERPYTEKESPNPINVYGKTKLAGEEAIRHAGAKHLIFRTSWVYGIRGKNFLKTIVRLAGEKDELKVVNDQYGAPTWSRMIAECTALVIARCGGKIDHNNQGLYNLSAAGKTTWHGFAEAILNEMAKRGLKTPHLKAISSAEYITRAKRPADSLLDNSLIKEKFGLCMPDWHTSMESAFLDFYLSD